MNGNYYCYSKKLYHFLSFLGFRYTSSSINSNSGVRYWVYEKSEKLDSAIEKYNNIKCSVHEDK